MTTSAAIIAHSRNPAGSELTTFEVVMPRIILPEITRHRCLSFSVQSSRAVPVSKLIQSVRENPFVPEVFTKNAPGMSGGEPVEDQEEARSAWIEAAISACENAEIFDCLGLAKEHANRVLEPFVYVAAVITGSEWDNFYDLRISKHAQPEIRELAEMMKAAQEASVPVDLEYGQDHSPYHDDPLISAAMCARISYQTRQGQAWTDEENMLLAEKLAGDAHWSPFEHQATPYRGATKLQGRNFHPSWVQHRAIVEGYAV